MLFVGIIGLSPTACKNNSQAVLDFHKGDSVLYEYVLEMGDNDGKGEVDTCSRRTKSWMYFSFLISF